MQAALSVCSAEVTEARNGQKRVENKRTQRFAIAHRQGAKTLLPPRNFRTTVSCSGFRATRKQKLLDLSVCLFSMVFFLEAVQTLLSFFPLQLSEGAWCGGSGDETRREYGMELSYTVTSNLCS